MPRSSEGGSLLLVGSATAATAVIGALASVNAPEFYAQLARPSWAPPASVFGPVWTILYVLMAFAAWQIARGGGMRARRAVTLFLVQLVFNALWSWLFFRWRLGALACAEVLVLWALVLLTTWRFWQIRRSSGALMLPYAVWVTFASALTFAIWRLNPSLL